MKITIDRDDRAAKMQGLTESVRRNGLPSDPMEIARLLGIGDKFEAMVKRSGAGRGRRGRIKEDEGFEKDILG